VALVVLSVNLNLYEEFLEDHVNHKQEVLVDILAKMLEFNHELVEKCLIKYSYKGPCKNECYLELPHKEEQSSFFNFGLLKDIFVISYYFWSLTTNLFDFKRL
jgi:hypothetical protein